MTTPFWFLLAGDGRVGAARKAGSGAMMRELHYFASEIFE
jgi:hypothetical protein